MSNERSFPPTIYWTDKKIETRADYLAGIRHEAWAFPYCRGFVPPVEWAREAWELYEVQRFLVPDIQWFLGRPGTLEAARKRLEATSRFLSTEQVVRLFLETRKAFSHQEWRFRGRFEAAFAEHVEFLPSELTRDEIIEALKSDGCDESQAILMADRAEQKKRASAGPPRENDSYFWPPEGLRREWPGRNPPFEQGSLAAQIATALSEPGYRPSSWEELDRKIHDAGCIDFDDLVGLYGLARSVSKTGSLSVHLSYLLQASEVLATEHVIQLFLLLGSIRSGEPEFRVEFEEGFPEHAPFLPPPGPEEPRIDWQGNILGRDFGFYFSGRPVRVLIDTGRITDWKSFHDVFADAFGFPSYYGCNLDAFFDCLSCIDSPESGMTKIQWPPKGVVVIELSNPADLKVRCPGIYSGLVKTIGEINERRERRIVGVSIYPAGWTATVEGAEGADWPPEVDAHGNEISFLATRVDEPRPFVEYKGEDCPSEPD